MPLDADKNRLQHMISAADEALDYSANVTLEELRANRPLQHLLIHNLEILGEAASRVSDEFKRTHEKVPWRSIVATRNRLIHAYFSTDLEIVLKTVQDKFPKLLEQLRAIRSELEEES